MFPRRNEDAPRAYQRPILPYKILDMNSDENVRHEPRWPVLLAALAVGGLYAALPSSLAIGPRWLQLAIVVALLVPAVISHHFGYRAINHAVGLLLPAVITIFLIWSVVLLVAALPGKKEPATTMLRSAAALWWTNVLVFATWYWRLDAGGPYSRARREEHTDGAFLFPQMQMNRDDLPGPKGKWSPRFVDYLFLAFNTSTALSPTDAPVLSRWAKVLMMIQSSISLPIVAVLLGRAINII